MCRVTHTTLWVHVWSFASIWYSAHGRCHSHVPKKGQVSLRQSDLQNSRISRRLALTVYSVKTVTLSMHVREGYLTGLLRLAITITVFFLLLVVCLDRRMIQLTTNRPLNTCRRSGLGLPALARHLGLYVCYVGCA